jgi:hypothetical protein
MRSDYDWEIMIGLPFWQLLTILTIPTFGIFLGILLNHRAANKLAGALRDMRKEVTDFRKQMHDEYIGLLNMIGDHGQTIVPLEERGSRSS